MKEGTIVAVNGNIYEYVGFDEHLQMHQLSEIDIDEDGHLTATYGVYYMPDDEFAFSEDGEFTQRQWYGIVELFIRQDYGDLTEMQISGAVMDIVDRCFAYGVPHIHELANYIAEYMDR